MPNDADKTWCPEIYKNLFINRWNDDKIGVAPCCDAYNAKIEQNATFDFNTNPYLTNLREKFNRGEKPKECSVCWKSEEMGRKSRRQASIEYWHMMHGPEIDRKTELEGIDFHSTWICNLACIMCCPENSSKWAAELGIKNIEEIGRSSRKYNDFMSYLDFDNLTRAHFNGGEPLINDEHLLILDKIKSNQVIASYQTNGTVKPSEKTIEAWKKLKMLKMYFSIDGIGRGFNYIRWPGDWDEVEENILWYRETFPDMILGFNVTIGAYNLFELSDIYDWFYKNLATNKSGDRSDFSWQLANNFDVRQIRTDVRDAAVKTFSDNPYFEGLSYYLQTVLPDEYDGKWISKLEEIDRRRGTDWKKSLKIGQWY